MKTAKPLYDHIRVNECAVIDGVTCVTVDCCDYMQYQTLPHAIEYEGKVLGKTGWNSDKGYCSYQSNAMLARNISSEV